MNILPFEIFTLIITAVLAIIGYFLRTVHLEVKLFIKDLTLSTTQLRELVVSIQTQIDKSIDPDIVELKADVKTLYEQSYNPRKSA